MYTFLLSDSRHLGTYKPVKLKGRRTALLVCPGCGLKMQLKTHTISDDGVVTPSVVCRVCDFHEYVLLREWSVKRD